MILFRLLREKANPTSSGRSIQLHGNVLAQKLLLSVVIVLLFKMPQDSERKSIEALNKYL